MNPSPSRLSRRAFGRLTALSVAATALDAQLFAAPRAPELARLDSNENPYGPSMAAMRAVQEALSLSNRYPDEHEELLIDELARLHAVADNQILLGNGSSELLKIAALAFTGPDRSLVAAHPTFEALARHATVSNAPVVEVPLTPDYRHDLAKMQETKEAGLIYLCNPNNPTASITPKEEVRAFLSSVGIHSIVLVDEAYHHYVESSRYETLAPLVRQHPNLVVLRTFSKIYGMAGLRCGYAVGQSDTIGRMRQHTPWNNVNIAALAAARASIADTAHVERNRRRNTATREELVERLDKLGLSTIPSHANFVMVDIGTDVRPVIAGLRDREVRVGRLFPALPTHLRVTIGKPQEMERFVDGLRRALAAVSA